MIAARYSQTGGSGVLEVGEIETPQPGPGEVLVRLAVAGVNPTDWKARAGATGPLNFDFQVPGQDGAGVIEAVGEGVAKAWKGERVWVYLAGWQSPWGTAAERNGKVDRIVEVALGPNLELDLAVANPHATIVTYAADQSSAELPIRAAMTANLTFKFMLLYTIPEPSKHDAIGGVSKAVEAGALTVLPLHRFPLAETAAAHDAVENGAVGKVVIDTE